MRPSLSVKWASRPSNTLPRAHIREPAAIIISPELLSGADVQSVFQAWPSGVISRLPNEAAFLGVQAHTQALRSVADLMDHHHELHLVIN